jgi:uncharacterized protein YndB with AHSA1/START domain
VTGGRDPGRTVTWKLHLASSPAAVHAMLATDEGRARFWAESASARDGTISFVFPDSSRHLGSVLANESPARFAVEYLGGSRATFELVDDGQGGTDLTLTDEGVPERWFEETRSGWVSVLMALKAAVDHRVDLRSHDPSRTWEQGYADN